MRKILLACLVAALAIGAALSARPAAALTFAVIQPGQPGSPAEAQPVMDSLATYLSGKLGVPVTARYANDPQGAAELLAGSPDCGIVALGVYMEQAGASGMTAIASSRPGGAAKDTWRLLVPTGGPTDVAALTGEVSGTVLYEAKAASCLLFGKPASALSCRLAGTNNPLRALRKVASGSLAGVVLDQAQYKAASVLPATEQCQVLVEREVPASPVVWFGQTTPETEKLAKVLTSMRDDPEAGGLLTLLLTDGFAPADPDLASLAMEPGSESCPR